MSMILRAREDRGCELRSMGASLVVIPNASAEGSPLDLVKEIGAGDPSAAGALQDDNEEREPQQVYAFLNGGWVSSSHQV